MLLEDPPIARNGSIARRVLAAWVRNIQTPSAILLTLAGVPVLIAAWAVVAPANLVSKVMTQDLMFNLAGAWQVYQGQSPHIDFHDPTGQLSFLLTAVGFDLLGLGPRAFLVNVLIVAAFLFLASLLAVVRRLPLLPAVLFILFICLLALVPANVGDRPDHYSFAMSYNRYCWGAYCILALILFVPPHVRVDDSGIDLTVSGALLAMMFYFKITYFAAGLGTVGFAMLVHPHVSRRWRAWFTLSILLLAFALAPHNYAYLGDILAWSASGAIRMGFLLHLSNFVAAIGQYVPYLATIVVACGMWRLGYASLRFPLTQIFLFGMSLLLLSQNSQAGGLPTGIVMLLALYNELRTRFSTWRDRDIAPLLLTILVFPFFTAGAFAASIAGYHATAARDTGLFVVDRTNLRGLAVPGGERGAFLSFSQQFDYPTRADVPHAQAVYQLTNYEYLIVLLEAAKMLDGQTPGGIALFDCINPLPFMLGWEAPRGANLWSTWNAPVRSPADYLAGVRYVLVPKFSLNPDWTNDLMRLYGDYLQNNFRWEAETRGWILLVRSQIGLVTGEREGHM